MIQAQDLRVGNIYNRKHGKGHTQTVIDQEMIGKIFSADSEFALDDFEPITLTPEILIACGLTRREETPHLEYWHWGENPYNGDFAFVIKRNSDNGVCFFINIFYDKLKYLHQLQNLFYNLTSKELNYKP